MSNNSKQQDIMPWYKYPWVWFIISLPASVVVASMITIVIAFNEAPTMVEGHKKVSSHIMQSDDYQQTYKTKNE